MSGNEDGVTSETLPLPEYSYRDEVQEIAPEVRPITGQSDAQTAIYDTAYKTALAAAKSGADDDTVAEAARSAAYGTGLDHASYQHDDVWPGEVPLDSADHSMQHAPTEQVSASSLLGLGSADESYLDRADGILEETLDKDVAAKEAQRKAAADAEAQDEAEEEESLDAALTQLPKGHKSHKTAAQAQADAEEKQLVELFGKGL